MRVYRARPPVGVSIGDAAVRLRADLENEARRLGSAASAWAEAVEEALGPELASLTRPLRMQRGVLWIEVANTAIRYRVASWLRGGGVSEISKRAGRGRVSDVRVVLARGDSASSRR